MTWRFACKVGRPWRAGGAKAGSVQGAGNRDLERSENNGTKDPRARAARRQTANGGAWLSRLRWSTDSAKERQRGGPWQSANAVREGSAVCKSGAGCKTGKWISIFGPPGFVRSALAEERATLILQHSSGPAGASGLGVFLPTQHGVESAAACAARNIIPSAQWFVKMSQETSNNPTRETRSKRW